MHDLQVKAGVIVTVTMASKDMTCVGERERGEEEQSKKRGDGARGERGIRGKGKGKGGG